MSNGKAWNILFIITFVCMIVALYLAFLYAPVEATQGNVYRILFFHVPSAWVAFLAFGVTCFCSGAFLMKKDLKWDRIASSSAEIGLLLCTITLMTGSIWAKSQWGVWWAWDGRLTSTLILWLIYLSYVMLRGYIDVETKRAYLSSVVGIIGFIDVIIVYFSIRWWRTQHPQPVIGGGDESGLAPAMLFTLLFCVGTFTLLFFTILIRKIELQKATEEVEYFHKLLAQK